MKNFFQWFLVIGFFLFLIFFVIGKQDIWTSDVQVNNSCTWRPCLQEEARPPSEIQFVKIAGKIIKVEVVSTPETREKGLSERKELKEDEGMLFVFDYSDKYSFWMKDMNFAIDIIWLGEDLGVVYIKKNAQPKSYPETFIPNQDAMYVLEVFSSFSEKNNLKKGDKVEFLFS